MPEAAVSECRHDRIIVYAGDAGGRMWACASCAIRMYPACRTCIDVGHRNEDHVATLDAARAETPGLREALEILLYDLAVTRQNGGSRARRPRTAELNAHATLQGLSLTPELQQEVAALRAALAPDTEETL